LNQIWIDSISFIGRLIDHRMDDDPVINVLPIHYSNALAPNLHIHQFPLLNRPLQTPPSAALSGKRIRARIKPNVRRLEVHIPADIRPGFWNGEKSKELGAGRLDDDRDKNQELGKGKQKEDEEPRLGEVRMRSEQIQQKGSYMLGIVRGGRSLSFNFFCGLLIAKTQMMDRSTTFAPDH
jgi:DNA-directed RNA polymerase-3 subunit RPC5